MKGLRDRPVDVYNYYNNYISALQVAIGQYYGTLILSQWMHIVVRLWLYISYIQVTAQ